MLRSAGRYKALDETAVFGFSCRHEFPKKFISLKHGERYDFKSYQPSLMQYLFFKAGISCLDVGKNQ